MASILGAGIGEVYRCPCDGRQLKKVMMWRYLKIKSNQYPKIAVKDAISA